MAKNVAVGLLRPPHVFFYEVDVGKGHSFRNKRRWLSMFGELYFKAFSIYRTKNGYHFLGYPYRKKIWIKFKKTFKSDFTIKLRPRWNRKNPQVLRISEKWDLKTGRITSPAPKFILGNLKLDNIQNYKVLYYAK